MFINTIQLQMIHFKLKITAVLVLFFVTYSVYAQTPNELNHEQALKIILEAKKQAENMTVSVNIAIVDAGANLKAFIRMDESFLGSIDVSIKKAKTARYFNIDTGKLGELTQPGGIIYNIEHSNGGLITFPGGIPIKNKDGKIIGAIGVSGGTIEQDRTIAIAGAKAITY